MENKIKKTIGIILCIIFGVFILSSNFIRFIERLGIDAFSFITYFYMFTNLAIIAATIFAGTRKGIYSSIAGKIGAFGLIGVYSIFLLNQVAYLINGNGFLSFGAVSLVSAILTTIFMGLFLFNLKTWLPIKITGFISCIPGIINGAIYMRLSSMYANNCYYSDVKPLYNIIDTCNTIECIIYLAVIVLSIIWMVNKPKAPSLQTNQIDMI